MAATRGVEVFTVFCESHTTQVPFHAVARLLRSVTGVEGLDARAARDRVREMAPDAEAEDLLLFDNLVGIGHPYAVLPRIDPDARRRRLTAAVNTATLARDTPAVYVVEDAHWIDEVSESMIADFLTVIPQTRSLVLVTYRPEYRGALTRVADAQTIALAPLRDSDTAALLTGLLGPDPSGGGGSECLASRRRQDASRGDLSQRPSGAQRTVRRRYRIRKERKEPDVELCGVSFCRAGKDRAKRSRVKPPLFLVIDDRHLRGLIFEHLTTPQTGTDSL
jgi:hypothetical protein